MIQPIANDSLDSQLARVSNYICGPWWTSKRGYATSGIPTLSWPVSATNAGTTAFNQELAIRGAACAAFALAVPIFTGSFDQWSASITSVTTVQRLYAAKLVVACARQHVAATTPLTGAQTWGHSWESPLWAAYIGLTAQLGWFDLIPNATDRNNVLSMVESECDWVMTRLTDFWQVPDGNGGYIDGPNTLNPNDGPVRTGNSAAEELSWNATVLWVGTALMPTHPNAGAWRTKAVELNVCSFANLADLQSAIVVDGSSVASWIAGRGFNVDNIDRVTNHGRIHPDYMTTITQNLFGWTSRAVAGFTTPIGSGWNFNYVYSALQVAPLDSAGTTAYNVDQPIIHFPNTTPTSDWGARRPAAYACFDVLATLFFDDFRTLLNQDAARTMPAAYWSGLHAGDSANMQLRPTPAPVSPAVVSTHPYGAFIDASVSPAEATYPEEDVYAASQLAFARLAQYLKYNRPNLWEG